MLVEVPFKKLGIIICSGMFGGGLGDMLSRLFGRLLGHAWEVVRGGI